MCQDKLETNLQYSVLVFPYTQSCFFKTSASYFISCFDRQVIIFICCWKHCTTPPGSSHLQPLLAPPFSWHPISYGLFETNNQSFTIGRVCKITNRDKRTVDAEEAHVYKYLHPKFRMIQHLLDLSHYDLVRITLAFTYQITQLAFCLLTQPLAFLHRVVQHYTCFYITSFIS